MFTKSFLGIKTMCGAVVISSIFCVGMFFSQTASAATATESTLSELQTQLSALLARITALQGGSAASVSTSTSGGGSSVNRGFAVGSEVMTTENLRVRSYASLLSTIKGTARRASEGTVVSGPVSVAGMNWYQVSFKSGLTGWVAGNWLQSVKSSVPTTATTTYTNVDVQSITKQVVAGNPMMADGGYTLYTITLKTGRKIEVKISNGPMTADMVEAEFRKAEFVGNVSELISKATEATATTTTYTNVDVQSITKQVVAGDSRIADSGYTLYTITLKTGRKIEVKIAGLMTSSMVEAEFRKTGFAGSVTNLLAQAISPTTATFTNIDVQSITKKVVAAPAGMADGGYTLYTITLKTGRKIEVKISSGPMTASMVEAEFRKTGFAGTVSNLIAQATVVSTATPTGTGGAASTTTRTGSVRGASTDILSEISVTLTTIENMIAELK